MAARLTMRLDIAICTRNRLEMLRDAVPSVLADLAGVPGGRLLLLDNGSSDGTSGFIADLAADHACIVALTVPEGGLYNARTVAIEHSNADILVFCDDDVRPAPGALVRLMAVFQDASIGVVGAHIDGCCQSPLPQWFSERFQRYIPILPLTEGQDECRYPSYPPGAFLALRRSPCLDLYLRQERRAVDLGYGGAYGLAGEDTDLCEIFAHAGYRVLRDAGVKVTHHFDATRLSEEWITERYFREGRLRVLMARLRGGNGLDRHTGRMLVALPALWLLDKFGASMGPSLRIHCRAYLRKSQGAWWELLRGTRFPCLPYT